LSTWLITLLRTTATIIVLSTATISSASNLLIIAEGTAAKTSSISKEIFEKRAISKALQSVVQSSAQSLESFSLVENGKVLFDQISAKAEVKIGGYRVISVTDNGSSITAKVEVLLVPSKQTLQPMACRQPVGLNIEILWDGMITKRPLPFWLKINPVALSERAVLTVRNDKKFTVHQSVLKTQEDSLGYSLYEKKTNLKATSPKYQVRIGLELSPQERSSLIAKSKLLKVRTKAVLLRKSKIQSEVYLDEEITLERSDFLTQTIGSGLQRIDGVQSALEGYIDNATKQVLQKLNCQNFIGSIKKQNHELIIDFGYSDGLLEQDIFSSTKAGTQQHYFTVKKMSENQTTLRSLSHSEDQRKFKGMRIRLLERLQ
jgi:hypothetical protein